MERLWLHLCRTTGLIGGLAFLVVSHTPVVSLVRHSMVTPAETGQADAIVVLGAGISPDGVLDAPSLRRALAGLLVFRAGRAPLILFLGPRHGAVVQAEARARLAYGLGIDPGVVLTEARGLTTRQEAARCAERLLPHGRQRIILVSGEHHLWRASALFRRAGFTVISVPSNELPAWSSRPDQRITVALHLLTEAAARVISRAAGHL